MLSLQGSTMGLGRKIISALTKHPILNGCLAALATWPIAYPLFQEQWKPDPTYWEKIRWGLPPISAFFTVATGTIITKIFTRENDRTRLSDYKLRRKLEEELKSPPTFETKGTQQVSYTLTDLYTNLFHPDKAAVLKRAKETRNPLSALDVAMEYLCLKKYDDGLIVLRDALDMLEGKKPKISPATKLQRFAHSFGSFLSRNVELRSMEAYMTVAALYSITEPEKSWYWSKLGTLMANALDHPNKTEMHVFHALLAKAQKRSDLETACKDAFTAMRQTCTPRRIGESRHPAWILETKKAKEFFSGTFAFKGNENREEFENEWNAALKLESILDETAIAPQPIYITDRPHDGLYVYIMRYLEGELLEEQLKKENKSGLFKVIPVLARILSRYPTKGLDRVDIAEKTYKKLAQVGMQDAMHLFKPVIDDLQAQKDWKINKDAHPGQWQMINDPYITARVGVLDTDIREVQPAILDAANLLEYCGTFQPAERQAFVLEIANNLKEEGVDIRGKNLFKTYNNAALFRVLCALVALNEKGRNKTREEIEHLAKNGIRAAHDMRRDAPEYYEQNREKYDKLPEFYANLKIT